MKKKWIAFCLVLVMLLTACGTEEDSVRRGKQREAKSKNSSGTNTVTPTATPTKEPEESRTIRMWSNAIKSSTERYAYDKAAQEMRELYPDVILDWTATESEAYKTKLASAAAANSGVLPDFYLSWSAANLRDLVESGRAYNLNGVYEKHRQQLPEHMCKNMTVDGIMYGIPIGYSAIHLYFNLDLLKSVGYTLVPNTFEELLICCDKLRAVGVYPFGCASYGNETWCISEYFETILLKICGEQELDRLFLGKKTWENEDVIKAAELLQTLVRGEYIDPNCANMSNEEVCRRFINGEYAFYINGSWQSPNIAANMSDPAIGDFPVIDPARASAGTCIGGPNVSFVVSPFAEDPEFVAEYAFELARRIAKYEYLSEAYLPAWKIDYDDSQVNALSVQAAHDALEKGGMVLYGDNMISSYQDIRNYFLSLYHLCALNYDPETFAAALKSAIR